MAPKFVKDGNKILKTDPQTVDVTDLKQKVLDGQNSIKFGIEMIRPAQAQLDAIKADIPDFDDTPLNPGLAAEVDEFLNDNPIPEESTP